MKRLILFLGLIACCFNSSLAQRFSPPFPIQYYYDSYGEDKEKDFGRKRKHETAQYSGSSMYDYAKSILPLFTMKPVILKDTLLLLSLQSPCSDGSYLFQNTLESLLIVNGELSCPTREFSGHGYKPTKYITDIPAISSAKYWGTLLSPELLNTEIFSAEHFVSTRDALNHYLGFIRNNDGLYFNIKETDVVNLIDEYKKVDRQFSDHVLEMVQPMDVSTQARLLRNYQDSEIFKKIGDAETRNLFQNKVRAYLEKIWEQKRKEVTSNVSRFLSNGQYYEAYQTLAQVEKFYPYPEEMAEMKCQVANGYLESAKEAIHNLRNYETAKTYLDFAKSYCPVFDDEVATLTRFMESNPLSIFINGTGYGADAIAQKIENHLRGKGYNTTRDQSAKNIFYSLNVSMIKFDQPEPVVQREEKTFYLKEDCYKTTGYGATKKTEKGLEAVTPVKVVFLNSKRVNYYEYNILITKILPKGNETKFDGGYYSKKPDNFRTANTDYNWGKLSQVKMSCTTGWAALAGLIVDVSALAITAIADKKADRTKESNSKLFNEAATDISNSMIEKFEAVKSKD